MVKGIAYTIAALILAVIAGIVLAAIGKFLMGVAFVVGMFLIAGLVLFGIFGKKALDFKSLF